MFNSDKIKYLVRQDKQNEWFFFYDENNGICFKKNYEGHWDSDKVLIKDGLPGFDVIIDDNKNIHLVCRDRNFNIIYLLYNNDKWHKYVILKNKSNKPKPKNFKSFIINNFINLIYIIEHEDKHLLVHQILNHEQYEPSVIDYISSSSLSFSAALDDSNNIYLYYLSERAGKKLGYKYYAWANKTWSQFKNIDDEETEKTNPYMIIDNKNNTHLCYVKELDNHMKLCYKRLLFDYPNDNKWDDEIEIWSSPFAVNIVPVILKVENDLYLMWQSSGRVLYSYSKDNGITWSTPSQFLVGSYKSISIIGFRTAIGNEMQMINCNLCYGYETENSINLYLLTNYLKDMPEKKAENKKYISDVYDIEKFAQENMHYFSSKLNNDFNMSDYSEYEKINESDNIEVSKLKIMIDMLKEELKNYQNNILTEIHNIKKNIEENKENINEIGKQVAKHFNSDDKNLDNSLDIINENNKDDTENTENNEAIEEETKKNEDSGETSKIDENIDESEKNHGD